MTSTTSQTTSAVSAADLDQYFRNLMTLRIQPLAEKASAIMRDMARLREEGDHKAAEGAFGLLTSLVAGICAAPVDSAWLAGLKIAALDDILPILRHEHALLAAVVEAAQQVERHKWMPN